MTNLGVRIRIAQSLAEVSAAAWNNCAGYSSGQSAKAVHGAELTAVDNSSTELSTRGQGNNPFISHEFLSSLEESYSVRARTGWQPRHLLAEDMNGELLGAAPCYAKSHSRGEYVFDLWLGRGF